MKIAFLLDRPTSAGIILALAVLVALFVGRDTVDAASFNPTYSATVVDSAPGANSDIITTFGISAPDSNFGGVVGFVPPGWGVAADADITDGAVVAQLNAVATLSLFAGGCNTIVDTRFTMMDATTNTSNPISPAGPENDVLENLAQDADNNGIPDGAERWPTYLSELFDEADPPRARQFGWDHVAGTTVILNFLIFEPGATLDADTTPDVRLGYPSVTVLLDPTTAPSASIIGDFCAPLNTDTTTFGLARENLCAGAPGTSGCEDSDDVAKNRRDVVTGAPTSEAYRTNPSEGSHSFIIASQSLRDAENDGHENTLDACPLTADPSFDPRGNPPASGDNDGDGIPNSCDPFPDTPSEAADTFPLDPNKNACPTTGVLDEDNDCFNNRSDNCPLIQNGLNIDGDAIGASPAQEDTDSDGIGDACDPNVNLADGDVIQVCSVQTVTISELASDTIVDLPAETATCPQVAVAAATAAAVTTGGDTSDVTVGTTDTTDTTGGTGGAGGGPSTGVGSLAPVVASIPTWAAIASGLGGAGLLGSLGAMVARVFRRRH